MRDPLYVLNFLGQGTRRDPSPDYYRGYFLDYTPEKWVSGVAGGAFKYIDETDAHYDLVIQHSAEHGVSLAYTSGEGAEMVYLVSIGDAARLSEIIDISSDEFVPVGAFIPPQQAWPVIEAFLTNPTTPPVADFMHDIDDTDWPDIEY